MKLIYWLKPGLNMKRWLILGSVGIIMVAIAFGLSMRNIPIMMNLSAESIYPLALVLALMGISILIISVKQGTVSLMKNLDKTPKTDHVQTEGARLAQMVYDRQVLSKGPKFVVIGGGTGLSVLLRGMKQITSNISAVVTVADDGGGSGVLREDLGMLPPGDIRSCLLALAEMEPTMEALLQYRFTEGALKGQSFGNLFVASMNGISENFEEAVKKMGEVLAVKGRVYPVTLEDITLFAQLVNGKVIKGESKIPIKSIEENSPIDFVFLRPRRPSPLPEVIAAIETAEVIILGPGSLFTSIIPNLLINQVTDKINKSKGLVVYLPNLMTQPGETDHFSVHQHVEELMKNTGLEKLDLVLANSQKVSEDVMKKYQDEGAEMVLPGDEDRSYFKKKNIKFLEVEAVEVKSNYVRHDALKVSRLIHSQLIDSMKNV